LKQTQIFERSNKILIKKLLQYLIPSVITMAALSLNEFLDSMVVSVLLDSQALSIVNLGLPVMLCITAIYTLLGNGGSTLYAVFIGKRDTDSAGKTFWVSMITGFMSGLLFLIFGLIFLDTIAKILCNNVELLPAFKSYLRALLISAPFLTTILTFVDFLTPSGAPSVATVINIVANGIGVLMDYVYIKYFNMGVNAAAWSTLTGYSIAALLIIYVVLARKVTVFKSKVELKDFKLLREISALGVPSAISQFGFALKFGFCNNLAMMYGGTAGMVGFSLCTQVDSIISVFLAAIAGAGVPLIAVLHGQRDYRGETGVLKTTLIYQFIAVFILFLTFFIFPQCMTRIYNISDAVEIATSIKAIRIFVVLYLFRGFYMIFMKYLQVLKRTTYAMLISIFDGFAGIIPISLVMCYLFGITGLWYSFGINSLIILLTVILTNKNIEKKSQGKLNGVLLSAHEMVADAVFDVTIHDPAKNISDATTQFISFCREHDIDKRNYTCAALAIEEMAVYTKNHSLYSDYMDILVRLYDDKIEIDFRTLGSSFNPLVVTEEDNYENITLLKGISSSVEYSYIMGMNCTQIIINKKGNLC